MHPVLRFALGFLLGLLVTATAVVGCWILAFLYFHPV